MTTRSVHVHIRRLVIDGGVPDALLASRDPALLSALIAARLEGGPRPPGGSAPTWQGAVADAVARSAAAPTASDPERGGDR